MRFGTGLLLILIAATSPACGGGGGGAPPPPLVPRDDLLIATGGTANLLPVLANDGGDPGAGIAVGILTPPRHGTAAVEADGRIRFEPDPAFNGTDTFTYSAAQGTQSGEATVRVTVYAVAAAGAPAVYLPRLKIDAREIGVIVNDRDPQSVAVADYYVARRRIPASNVVHLDFAPPGGGLTAAEFAPLKTAVDAALGPDVQALAITWTAPWHVAGMSITSAFSLGFDAKYYNTSGNACAPTAPVDYFASDTTRPYTDLGFRPAMMLAGNSVDEVKALIDRGLAADGTAPTGTVWFARTTDTARSVRWPSMESAVTLFDHAPDGLAVSYLDNSDGSGSNLVENQSGVLVYETGLARVSGIATNTYRPGAIADHLTSFGGVLDTGSQMTVLAWLAAGVTGSFGTVEEPCNYVQKFPDPVTLLHYYYLGGTLIEAYWKSVRWPGEGLFVGEPLASPYGRFVLSFTGGVLTIRTSTLVPGRAYRVVGADSPDGPFDVVRDAISVDHYREIDISITNPTRRVYRFEPAN